MAKGSKGGRRAVAANNNSGGGTAGPVIPSSNVPGNATPMTDQDAQQLRDLQDTIYNGSLSAAVKMYIAGQPGTAAANFDGNGHSMAQTMNYLNEMGIDFYNATPADLKKYGIAVDGTKLASMVYADQYMTSGAHAIGKDTILHRAAHDTILQSEFGIADYTKLTEQQLKTRLIGGTYTTKAHMSTSYDKSKSPFLDPNSGIAGGREVIYQIKTGANTKVLLGAKAQTEVIVNKGERFRITDVSYTGNTATPRGGRSKKQILIQMETY